MQKWEYSAHLVDLWNYELNKGEWKRTLDGTPRVEALRDAPWEKKAGLDCSQDLGKMGWEMVSATPITAQSLLGGGMGTQSILFTFKRPIQEVD